MSGTPRFAVATICARARLPMARVIAKSLHGVAIPSVARELYRDLRDDEAAAFGDPFASGPGTFRAWLEEPMGTGEGPVITRLWDVIRRRRVDVQATMPDHLRADRAAFAAWHATSGHREHGVPDEL